MTLEEFLMLLDAAGIKYDRAEIAKTRKGGFQACIRVGRALFVGQGTTCAEAADKSISAAQLSLRPW